MKYVVVVSVLIMFLINYLANAIPFGGNTTGDISGKYDTLFTPSGFTFSIWGIIYLLVFIVSLSFLIREDMVITTNRNQIYLMILVVNILNSLWLYAWHNDKILLSTIIMLGLLSSLLYLTVIISTEDKLLFTTYSIYAGWISVATVANISILLYKYDLSIFMNYEWFWFYFILIVGVAIALYMGIKQKNIAYSFVFVWAYFGILMKYIK